MRLLQALFFAIIFLGGKIMALDMVLEFNGQRINVELEDNAASREFVAQLPLTLEFSDYVGKEKIAHLPSALNVQNTPGYNPQAGDFFYFAPWGNIGIFYAKQPPYNGLVYLGRLTNSADIEILKNIKGNFRATIRR